MMPWSNIQTNWCYEVSEMLDGRRCQAMWGTRASNTRHLLGYLFTTAPNAQAQSMSPPTREYVNNSSAPVQAVKRHVVESTA